MAGYLLLPEDELTLVAHLLEPESLTRLAHEDLAYGPQVASALTAPRALPEAADPPERLTFWASHVGALVREDTGSFVDHSRSPVVVWHRSHWHASGALSPGRISSQTRRRAEQPDELLALYDDVQRWMKRTAVKLPGTAHRAFPHAARWVAEGGRSTA